MSRFEPIHRQPIRRTSMLAWMAVTGLVLMALFVPGVNAVDAPGNNGTVKVHEGATEAEPIVRNEPHVCTFHLHFFFADPVQSGSWEIQEWAPGDKGTVVLSGTYDTAGDGEDRQPAASSYSLPDGHYKLFWDGDTDKHDKMKVFWVDCAAPTPTPTPTATPTPTPSPTPSPTATPTPTPTPSPTPTPNATPTPTPSPTPTPTPPPIGGVLPVVGTPTPTGEVLAETGSPGGLALPATDTADSRSQPEIWRVGLLLMAAALAILLATAPRRAARPHH